MIMVIFPSFLGVEGQTTSHCKACHEDQAMAPASDEDVFVGSFKRTPFRNRADLLFSRRSAMITSAAPSCGKEGDDHGPYPLPLRTRRADLLLSRR